MISDEQIPTILADTSGFLDGSLVVFYPDENDTWFIPVGEVKTTGVNVNSGRTVLWLKVGPGEIIMIEPADKQLWIADQNELDKMRNRFLVRK